jgi:hypothetical protein
MADRPGIPAVVVVLVIAALALARRAQDEQ